MRNRHIHRLGNWGSKLWRLAFFLWMAVGAWMMLSASISYLELGDTHPFFLEKLPLARPRLWLGALYTHVPCALFALPACLLLSLHWVRRRWPRFHRWLGRVSALVILGGVVPSGMYLALFAQGGMITTLGFWLTGAITFGAMLRSVHHARAGNIKAHRRYSAHVTAQLAVAVVSRFLLMGAESAGFYAGWVYVAALWLPVVGCALIAEFATGSRPFSPTKGSRHEKLVVVRPVDALR